MKIPSLQKHIFIIAFILGLTYTSYIIWFLYFDIFIPITTIPTDATTEQLQVPTKQIDTAIQQLTAKTKTTITTDNLPNLFANAKNTKTNSDSTLPLMHSQ